MKYLLTTIFFFIVHYSLAQITISGKIKYRNEGVKEVNITLLDTYDGATSGEDGSFSFVTSETGIKALEFSHPKFNSIQKEININKEDISLEIFLKEKISEIEAVVITAGAIEASDKNRSAALLTPIDIYTTAGADGQISTALNFLPGTQKVGESEGLFIRGGSGAESKIFIDGSLVNNYFTNSIPGIAGRDRFNTSLFKGNVFSSGGYSAIFGQALSGILILESVDLPEQTSYDIGISPIFLSGNYQKLNAKKTASFGGGAAYSLLSFMQKVIPFNTDFVKAPQGFSANANFRIKTKSGGFLKYYGNFDSNSLKVKSNNLEEENTFTGTALQGNSMFHTLSYKQRLGRYTAYASGSFSYNKSDIQFSNYANNSETQTNGIVTTGNYTNLKGIIERRINKISAIRGGLEYNVANEKLNFSDLILPFKDNLSSVFLETDIGLSNHLSAKIGLRSEHSTALGKSNLAPRFAMAYRFSKKWSTSLAYGTFYQNPESKYLNPNFDITFQKAKHYIAQIQRSSKNRTLRLEAFHKKYNDLIKTKSYNSFSSYAINNHGEGYANGLEAFWRDKETIKNLDYWISYSYLDTQRNQFNYPMNLTPTFAAKHTLSVVAKKFILPWKMGFNASYTFATGRPFYDIIEINGESSIRNYGVLKDYNALNLSMNYLPKIGKPNAKTFMVFVLSISNVLGHKNVFGYRFSQDGTRNAAILPPINSFVFIGAFLSFGEDKTEDAINNNL